MVPKNEQYWLVKEIQKERGMRERNPCGINNSLDLNTTQGYIL